LKSKKHFPSNQCYFGIFFCLAQILIISPFQTASAQNHSKKHTGYITPWEISLSVGFTTFVTSVNPAQGASDRLINYWYRDKNPGIGFSVTRNFSPALGVELNWLNTRLTGTWNDKWAPLTVSAGYPIPLTFNSKINQLDLVMTFNLNKIVHPGNEIDNWHLFFKTGLGLSHIKDNQDFFPGESPYNRLSFITDGGLSVSVSEKVKLMAGSSFRFVNTDNLDGVHVESTDLNGNTVGYINIFEIYTYTYLKMSYSLGHFGSKKSSCSFMDNQQKHRAHRKH